MSNTTISALEHKPLSGQKPKQLIVLLHGLGASADDLFSLAPYLSEALPDAQINSLDAPYPCDMAPVGKQWFSLQDRNEEAVYKGLSDVTPLLQDYLDKTIKELDLTYADVALLGFSQGSMLSLHFGFRNEETLGGILAFSGALAAADRLKNELKSTPPVCLIHGEDDDVVPFEAFKQATQALQKQNVPLQAYSREELGHGIDPAGLQLGIGFLRELFLAKEAA